MKAKPTEFLGNRILVMVAGGGLGLNLIVRGLQGMGWRPWGEGWVPPEALIILGAILLSVAISYLVKEIRYAIHRKKTQQVESEKKGISPFYANPVKRVLHDMTIGFIAFMVILFILSLYFLLELGWSSTPSFLSDHPWIIWPMAAVVLMVVGLLTFFPFQAARGCMTEKDKKPDQPLECLQCQATIAPDDTKCPECGWTWEK